ncbi:MAG: hypothetical protein ISR50_04560 [Alphaproteobacteria bacterium]|nr:hypothetical protein [Alphaproteobacteria bacterium]
MTRCRLSIIIALAGLLAACQMTTGGFAGGECEAKGHAQGSLSWQACVDAIYESERIWDEQRTGYGP